MQDWIHKIFYTGIGLASMTEERIQEIVQDLEKKGQVSKEEGKQLAHELVDKAKSHTENLRDTIQQEFDKLMGKVKLVSRQEFDDLKQKVDKLEKSNSASGDDSL